ncbi:MAG TPA: methyltransferase domain-containing protein [Cyclobacteriaceae bacterium]|nr:methyltransferase domain-containing protein [Cyclobacteriaceae bacterium]
MMIRKLRSLWNRVLFTKDERFYHQLFVENPSWNSSNPNHDEQLRWSAIRELIEPRVASPEVQILDVGSGRGWLTHLLSGLGKAQGLEPVRPVVRYARKLFPKLAFFEGSLNDFITAHPDRRFDWVVSSEVLEHVPDEEKPMFIRSLKSILQPTGHLVITTPRLEAMSALPYDPAQPVENWLTEDRLQALFLTEGFRPEEKRTLVLEGHAAGEPVYQVWLFSLAHDKLHTHLS